MKSFKTILILVFLVFAVAAHAGDKAEQQYLELAKRGYMESLKSNADGIRSSAAFQIVKFKLEYPNENLDCLVKCLKQASQTDRNLATRVHCQMAVYFLEQSNLSAKVNPFNYSEPCKFFSNVLQVYSGPQLTFK